MRDRLQIVEAFEELCAADQPSALATVVAVEGSSYRRPGARMLVAGDGRTWGTVSGGCLERDVARRARMLIPEQAPAQIVSYETDSEDGGEENARPVTDPGPSLGCGGRIEILIQRLGGITAGPMPALGAVVRERRRATVATVTRVASENSTLRPGESFAHFDDPQPAGQITGGELPVTLLEQFRKSPAADHSFELQRHTMPRGGWIEVLLEWLSPSQALAIFADGHDVAPLVELAKSLGWHVTVIGSRPLAALRQTFPHADQCLCCPESPAAAAVDLPADVAAIVMGHNFQRDAAALSQLLKTPRCYVGVLGPRRRTGRLLASIGFTGQEDNLYSPVGLDIGAENPEQVALAIVAEIQAVTTGRAGNSLRRRPGPIHPNASEIDKSCVP